MSNRLKRLGNFHTDQASGLPYFSCHRTTLLQTGEPGSLGTHCCCTQTYTCSSHFQDIYSLSFSFIWADRCGLDKQPEPLWVQVIPLTSWLPLKYNTALEKHCTSSSGRISYNTKDAAAASCQCMPGHHPPPQNWTLALPPPCRSQVLYKPHRHDAPLLLLQYWISFLSKSLQHGELACLCLRDGQFS